MGRCSSDDLVLESGSLYSFEASTRTHERQLGDKQVFLDFATNPMFMDCGDPDGMTHDIEGKLWVACWDA
ncbi:hypothetical protein IscW_ISCW008337 [Ixodes scapularis]|uniref:SMP-30/Gluconolactonase/LRE-like region domain-containing protein n=1 Tax=Ixodes scapularis TaxID=6945 RepID=B7PV40_IXOSC|nr:hypothetical protein IscW_ISCW008337 [Ixodes scapularis]|eukprot:XP_002407286.1 hypothetical protein IscW_ISCW008337 [Ixodes scapularis]